MKFRKDETLAKYTTFKIGGKADWFCEVKDGKEILQALQFAKKKNLSYFILGKGSNVLISDKGVRGLVIKIQNSNLKIQNDNSIYKKSRKASKLKIIAGAGVSLKKLGDFALKNSLTGLEFLAGIPGTLGGAIVSNAGAWQQSIGDKIERVKILNENNQFKWLNQKDCCFAYRQSRFKKNKEIILEAEIVLKKGNSKEIKQKIEENLKKRDVQPKEPSAGSVFINPKPKSAGDLIEKCGLKGKKIGQAQISEKHANFIINLGGAKASDVLKLITLARNVVKRKFNVELKLEINLLGEFS